MSSEELLRQRLNEIAKSNDKAAIGFITALLNAGGYTEVNNTNNIGRAFLLYSESYGKDVYFDIRDRLIKADIIVITGNDYYNKILQLNTGILMKAYNDTKDIERFASEYAEEFVDNAKEYFLNLLSEIKTCPEMEDALNMIAVESFSPDTRIVDSIINNVLSAMRTLGKLDLFYNLFYKSGILIIKEYGKITTYYKFFYPLKRLMAYKQEEYNILEDKEAADLLLDIYMQEAISSSYISKYKDNSKISTLLNNGFIKENTTTTIYAVTNKGKKIASNLLKRRCEDAKEEIFQTISNIPKKLIPLIIEALSYRYNMNSYHKHLNSLGVLAKNDRIMDWHCTELYTNKHTCLLKDEVVKTLTTLLFKLSKYNLLILYEDVIFINTKTYFPIEAYYVPNEVIEFIYTIAEKLNIPRDILPALLERKHMKYHIMNIFMLNQDLPTYARKHLSMLFFQKECGNNSIDIIEELMNEGKITVTSTGYLEPTTNFNTKESEVLFNEILDYFLVEEPRA